ncbi:hypothetical protein [Thalassospira sp. MCCC 1A03138]|uniref:hypothetical protein n=1 Tax=Thalassospira sp. MCCC 1A03138 TaxID=1470576 RepID=UPI00143D287F|nr:hypothetical protein [Thalassospira sp. MCCC 1A03138]
MTVARKNTARTQWQIVKHPGRETSQGIGLSRWRKEHLKKTAQEILHFTFHL